MRKQLCALSSLVGILLIGTPVAAQVSFGAAVAVGQGEVFVGEPDNEIEPGAVYVYRADSAGWDQVQRLAQPGTVRNDGFGRALAVQGDRLLVGADGAETAHLFRRDGTTWVHELALAPPGLTGSSFGAAVALAEGLIAVGAPDAYDGQGAVFVRQYAGDATGSWWELRGEGGDQPEGFGAALALQADRILVGAPGYVGDLFLLGALGMEAPTGAAYVFERRDDGWERVERLSGEIVGEGAIFGYSVALRGDEAAVGAVGASSTAGAVQLFRRDPEGDGWSPAGRVVPFDAAPGAFFGAALALAAGELLVGSPGRSNMEGRLYRFRRETAREWTEASKLDTAGLEWGTGYGSSVAIRGDLMAVGMPGDDFGAGSAVIMRRFADSWGRERVASEPRSLEPVTGGAIPCTEGKAGPFPCENVDLVSFLPVHAIGGGRGVTMNDLWGWTDPETGKDYAILGMRDGTSFVDVSDPVNPVFVGKLPKPEGSPASLWRDVKVYENHAFIVADSSGQHGMQVFDLTRLRQYGGEPVTFTEDAHYDRLASSHNLAINTDSGFAYAVGNSSGGETCGGGLHIINVEDPRRPTFVGCFQDTRTGSRGTGSSHDVQCVDYDGPDERYRGHEICFGSNETALSIADVTDKREPKAVAMATYPNVAYTHQGWLDEEHRYFYMNDEGDEVAGLVAGTRTLVWDVQDLEDPIMVGEFVADSPATDHNLYVVGDRMYQSNYRSGLRVFDISDRESPRPVGYFDTVPWGSDEGMGNILSGAIGSWSNYPFFDSGIVIVGSGKEGVFVLRARPAAR